MKISFKNKLHNCDKHIETTRYFENYCVVEFVKYCSICNRIKQHEAYGATFVDNYNPKNFY